MHATLLSFQYLAAIWKEAEAKGQGHTRTHEDTRSPGHPQPHSAAKTGLDFGSLASPPKCWDYGESHHFIPSPGLCAYVLVF